MHECNLVLICSLFDIYLVLESYKYLGVYYFWGMKKQLHLQERFLRNYSRNQNLSLGKSGQTIFGKKWKPGQLIFRACGRKNFLPIMAEPKHYLNRKNVKSFSFSRLLLQKICTVSYSDKTEYQLKYLVQV